MHKNQHIDTVILDNSPQKNPMWENRCSKGGFLLFSNSSVQQGAKLAYPQRENKKISNTSPNPNVSLIDPCVALRPSASAPT